MKYSYLAVFFLLFSANSALAGECKIIDQSWSNEATYCQRQGYPNNQVYRCYAIVEKDGTRIKVWGQSCWENAAACWSSGSGRVEPDCD